jgi:hypothetical protein
MSAYPSSCGARRTSLGDTVTVAAVVGSQRPRVVAVATTVTSSLRRHGSRSFSNRTLNREVYTIAFHVCSLPLKPGRWT